MNKGFGKEFGESLGVENWHSPETVLGEIGLKPDGHRHRSSSRTRISITSAMSRIFPKATFYIQEREIAKWVWAMSLPMRMRNVLTGIDPADILRGVDLARNQRLVCVDGDMQDVLPGIDLHAAFDTHTFGSMWVSVRNDGKRLRRMSGSWPATSPTSSRTSATPAPAARRAQYIPVGLATGSQLNLLMTTEEMVKAVGYETRRVIPPHEERLKDQFPSRITDKGLRITEICLADDTKSMVR